MKKLAFAAPWIFTLIWSSGFVVAKYGFEDSDSLYFLALRLLLAAVILFLLSIVPIIAYLNQQFKEDAR